MRVNGFSDVNSKSETHAAKTADVQSQTDPIENAAGKEDLPLIKPSDELTECDGDGEEIGKGGLFSSSLSSQPLKPPGNSLMTLLCAEDPPSNCGEGIFHPSPPNQTLMSPRPLIEVIGSTDAEDGGVAKQQEGRARQEVDVSTPEMGLATHTTFVPSSRMKDGAMATAEEGVERPLNSLSEDSLASGGRWAMPVSGCGNQPCPLIDVVGDSDFPPGEISESAMVLEDVEGDNISSTDGNMASASLVSEQSLDQLPRQPNGGDSPLTEPRPCPASNAPPTTVCSATSDDTVNMDTAAVAMETTATDTTTVATDTSTITMKTTTVATEATSSVDADTIAEVNDVMSRLRSKPESQWTREERVWELALRAGSTREEDRVELDEATKQRLRERVREVKGGGATVAGL